jgi:hypothetical protein
LEKELFEKFELSGTVQGTAMTLADAPAIRLE